LRLATQAEQKEAETWRHWDRKLLHRRFVDEPETPPLEHGDDVEEDEDVMEVGHLCVIEAMIQSKALRGCISWTEAAVEHRVARPVPPSMLIIDRSRALTALQCKRLNCLLANTVGLRCQSTAGSALHAYDERRNGRPVCWRRRPCT